MGPPNDTRTPRVLAGGRGEGWAVGRDPECLARFCFAQGCFRSTTQLSSRCALLFYRAPCADLRVFLLLEAPITSKPFLLSLACFCHALARLIRFRTILRALLFDFSQSCPLCLAIARSWDSSLAFGRFARSCLLFVGCSRSRAHLQAFWHAFGRFRSILGVFAGSCSLLPLLLEFRSSFSYWIALARSRSLSLCLGRSCLFLCYCSLLCASC